MYNLIFLHGLLGDKSDWQKLIEKLPHFSSDFRCIVLDLPFHGEAKQVEVADFEQTAVYLADKIQQAVGDKPYFLVGYSLGGRLALYYALQNKAAKGNLQGLILEGANLGLKTAPEKAERWHNDTKWSERFCTEAPEKVLNDWYRQPIFSHLSENERQQLILARRGNCGENIGKMLLATSLAKQPDFREKVRSNLLPIYYFVGEKDQKFRQLAENYGLNVILISQAGHNAHSENPTDFAEKMTALLLS